MRKTIFAALLPLAAAACATITTPPETAPGTDFLARNAVAKRVVTTPSGLQYFIVKSGPKNSRSPVDGDTVNFDYEGKLTTGEMFDSSYERGSPLTGGKPRKSRLFPSASGCRIPTSGRRWRPRKNRTPPAKRR